MGVLGLYSYFESKSLGQRKSWSTTLPSHSSLWHDGHRSATTANSSSLKSSDSLTETTLTTVSSATSQQQQQQQQQTPQQRFFILDGNAYIHHLYCGQFEWIWGGQYSSFVNLLKAHIRALENAGFRLQFLFDGPLPVQKRQTRLTRDTEKIRKMSRVVGDLERYHVLGLGGSENTLTSSEGPGVEALANQAGGASSSGGQGNSNSGGSGSGAGGAGGRGYSHFLIPPLVMEVTLQTLRELGVDLLVCDGEADGLVAQLAMEKSMDINVDEAYAVSKDSDYFIYNTGSSTKGGYIPLDSLFVSTDPTTHATTVVATVYSQSAIADHLGIQPQFLPLFASLTGNDYVRPEVFEDQIARSLAAATGQKLSTANNTNHARIKATANFLKQYGAGTKKSDGRELTMEEIILGYDQVNRVMDQILEDREQLYLNESAEKRQELRSELIESMKQYSCSSLDDFLTKRSSKETSLASSKEPTPSNSIVNTPRPLTPSARGVWAGTSEGPSLSLSTVATLHKTKEAFRAGQFSFKLMDVVNNQVFWCTPFLEDTDRESAWLTSRELRKWIYGILARDLYLKNRVEIQDESDDQESEARQGQKVKAEFEVIEYVRRGDHLSAEIVTGASIMELDEMKKVVQAKASRKAARRISVMDVDPATPSSEAASIGDTITSMQVEQDLTHQQLQDKNMEINGDMDEARRTSLFLGILGADTAQVRALPRPFMILAATLRYLINALAHSKTRSAGMSVANFEIIAFVASVLFLRETYHPQSVAAPVRMEPGAGLEDNNNNNNNSIPITSSSSSSSSIPTAGLGGPSLVEAPPMTKRSLHLSTQYQHALAAVSLLANALRLEDMIPPLAQLFDGLLFQQALALARGGTMLEMRMQSAESVSMYYQILAAVEEDFIDTGEIDVAVVFRASGKKGSNSYSSQNPQSGGIGVAERPKLGIFGPDMEPVNPYGGHSTSSTHSSAGSLKASKSAGIQKKSTSKKRSGGSGSHGGRGGSRGGSSGSGGGGAFPSTILNMVVDHPMASLKTTSIILPTATLELAFHLEDGGHEVF
ncbi:Protein asteroid 1 [Linnemannia zychae]|nr:Protein asteroid 1 [Linnemannia zychae]